MNTVAQSATVVKTVQFSDETYAKIDPAYGLVTIHRGQNTGEDSDWGGQVIATLELDKLVSIAKAAIGGDPIHAEWVLQGEPVPAQWFTQPDEAYAAMPYEGIDADVDFGF
jgi:hypothetical protein